MKKLLVLLLAAVVLGGCEKKVDPAKLAEANQLIEKAEYQKGVDLLDQLGKDSPSDAAVKAARIEGHLKFANYLMRESPLPPKEKYPSALRHYRAVLALDPAQVEAKQSAALIESIYKQMGRPIPE